MLSLGACAVDDPTTAFYVELQPINMAFVPEAVAVSGFDMQRLLKEGRPPTEAMKSFQSWVEKEEATRRPFSLGLTPASIGNSSTGISNRLQVAIPSDLVESISNRILWGCVAFLG